MTINEIVKNFNTTPFLFAGSGLTRRYYGLPNWIGLLSFFAGKLRADDYAFQYYESMASSISEDEKLPYIASLIESDFNQAWFANPAMRSEDKKVEEAVKSHVSPFKAEIAHFIQSMSKPKEEYRKEYDLLKQISIRNLSGVITTNYDCFFEDIFEGYKVFVGQNELVFSQLQGIGEIYKIHGSTDQPDTIVINQDDYRRFKERSKYLAAKLMTIFMEYPIIFIGYSISDPDIQAILSDIVECLPDDKVGLLQSRFVFVEYRRETDNVVVASHSMMINGKVLEMTKIILSDFSLLYEALSNKKAAFPVRLLRRFKDELYSFALTSEPGTLMQVASLDDKRIDENTLALTIGLAKTGLYGLAHAVNANQWYRNVILHDSHYPIDDMLELAYPDLLKTNSGKLPVWYYIANAAKESELAREKAPKSYDEIVNSTAISRNKTAVAGRNAMQIWTEENDNLGRALRLLVALPEEKADQKQIEEILLSLFSDNKDILETIGDSSRSNLRKLIRIYDYLAYRNIKTP